MPSRLRAAVVPTNFRSCLDQCLQALVEQAHCVVVINTTDVPADPKHRQVVILEDDQSNRNISRWWNIGLNWVAARAKELGFAQWDVAVINDDVIIPSGWFINVADAMRSAGAKAACTGGRGPQPILHTRAEPVDLYTRLQGFAFVLEGESGLRADEELVWWCGDDDLHLRAAALGGVLMLPGMDVEHLYPNGQMTPELNHQAGLDVLTFERKHGRRPW